MDTVFSQNFDEEQNKISEPPVPEIEIRTMESDLKAFREGGGEVPGAGIKTIFTPAKEEDEGGKAASFSQSVANLPGYSGSEKTAFTPENGASQSQGNLFKFIVLVIGILAVIIGLGLLGYYVVFPLIFK